MLKIYVVVMSIVVFVLAFMQGLPAEGLAPRVIVSLLCVIAGVFWGGLISTPRWIPPKNGQLRGRYSSGFFEGWSVTVTLLAVLMATELAQSPF